LESLQRRMQLSTTVHYPRQVPVKMMTRFKRETRFETAFGAAAFRAPSGLG
jgi:hypothetical protein